MEAQSRPSVDSSEMNFANEGITQPVQLGQHRLGDQEAYSGKEWASCMTFLLQAA